MFWNVVLALLAVYYVSWLVVCEGWGKSSRRYEIEVHGDLCRCCSNR